MGSYPCNYCNWGEECHSHRSDGFIEDCYMLVLSHRFTAIGTKNVIGTGVFVTYSSLFWGTSTCLHESGDLRKLR